MTTTILFGDLRTGRILDTVDGTSCAWQQVNNDAGAVDGLVVEASEVRAKSLRQSAPAAKTFLAVDVDGRLQEAGPVWYRAWDDRAQQLTLGAAGLWSLFDHRKVLRVLAGAVRSGADLGSFTVTGTDLGGIARALAALAMSHTGGDLPLILPPQVAGDRTETFPGWQMLWTGDQLRQITQREINAPDIRFRPRYTTDRLGVEWVMDVGTEDAPLLVQAGEDWYFDHTVPHSPVININTREDADQMGMRGWVTGEGSEEGTLIATGYDPTLVDAGWPLLEVEEGRSGASEAGTLAGHAASLVYRQARPVESWELVVNAAAAVEVLAGHYARVVVPDGHPWLPGGETFLRVKSKAGDLGDEVTLVCYPMRGVL